jgi:hypothetical protein
MTGYHEVQVFIHKIGEHIALPENWKPFHAEVTDGRVYIVCRKWRRTEG